MNIATIGSGVIVDYFIDAIHQVQDVTLQGVYSRSLEKAKEFANKHGAKSYFDSMERMLEDKNIDTIYIASPNSLHYTYALQCLEAGKHVICEKPFVSNPNELIHLRKVANEHQVFLFEAITNIHLPNVKIIKDHLKQLGDVKLFTANFSQYSSKYALYANHEHANVFDLNYSGGALMDINVYNVHLAVHLFGVPTSYKYYPNIGYNGIDTSGVLMLTYPNFIATCIGAKDSSSEYLAFIQGDKGTLQIDGASTGVCKYVHLQDVKGDSILKTQDSKDASLISMDQINHMSYELQAFQSIIETKNHVEEQRLFQHSLDVLTILYNARTQAGIHFPSDN